MMLEACDTLIVGGGQAGVQVASTLRSSGYDGSITILESSESAPYGRPPLSKGYLRGETSESELLLRPDQYWLDSDVDIELGVRALSVDCRMSELTTDTGRRLAYRQLVWTAGGRALRLPGTAELKGSHVVRTLTDARRLRAELSSAERVVVVGGGFVGLEAAAIMREAGLGVTVVEAQSHLLARVSAQPVAQHFLTTHMRHGVEVLTGAGVSGVIAERGRVREVELSDGRRLQADLLVVGIGIEPEVRALSEAGVVCSRGGVEVDEWCRTSVPNIFAAGDCAVRPSPYAAGVAVRIESVPNAIGQARIVASAITRQSAFAEPLPWFWSHQYDERLQTAGLALDYDGHVVRGYPESGRFSVAYIRDEVVVALDCVNSPRDFVQGKALVAARARADLQALQDAETPLKSLVPASG